MPGSPPPRARVEGPAEPGLGEAGPDTLEELDAFLALSPLSWIDETWVNGPSDAAGSSVDGTLEDLLAISRLGEESQEDPPMSSDTVDPAAVSNSGAAPAPPRSWGGELGPPHVAPEGGDEAPLAPHAPPLRWPILEGLMFDTQPLEDGPGSPQRGNGGQASSFAAVMRRLEARTTLCGACLQLQCVCPLGGAQSQ